MAQAATWTFRMDRRPTRAVVDPDLLLLVKDPSHLVAAVPWVEPGRQRSVTHDTATW